MSDKINRLIQKANIDKERAARLLEEMAIMETQLEELRTALADERKRALEEAAKALDAWGDIYGDNAAKTVRSLMETPK